MSAVPSAEENVPDSISKGETKLEESSGDILTVHEAAARIAVA